MQELVIHLVSCLMILPFHTWKAVLEALIVTDFTPAVVLLKD